MRVDIQLLEKIARLSRLEIREDQKEKLLLEFNKMLDFVDQLKSVNTDGVEPLTGMSFEKNAAREDEAVQSWTTADALRNAPASEGDFFKVPKVIRDLPAEESKPGVDRDNQ